jgi:hypothetical protein
VPFEDGGVRKHFVVFDGDGEEGTAFLLPGGEIADPVLDARPAAEPEPDADGGPLDVCDLAPNALSCR